MSVDSIVEFKIPKIQWSLYDPLELNEIEERLFRVSNTADDVNLNKLIAYRTGRHFKSKKIRNIKPSYEKIPIPASTLALKSRLQRTIEYVKYSNHFQCYSAEDTLQLPRNSDMSTNISYSYKNSHPSSIFTSLRQVPKCCKGRAKIPDIVKLYNYDAVDKSLRDLQSRFGDGTFTMLGFDFNHLLTLKWQYKLIHLSDTQFIQFLLLICLQLDDLNLCLVYLLKILESVYRCIHNKPIIPLCPGIIICVSPGVGKTSFLQQTGHFMIDTCFFKEMFDKDLSLMKRFVESGFSVITNRTEYREIKNMGVSILVTYNDNETIKNLENKGFVYNKFFCYSEQRRQELRKRSFKYTRRRVPDETIEEWIININEAKNIIPYILIKDSFAETMVQVYIALLG